MTEVAVSPSRPSVIGPQRHPQFSEVSLTDLRSYRQALIAEEKRVSYWRRLLQAKLDLVNHRKKTSIGESTGLRALLSDESVSRLRLALMSVQPDTEMPPLPSLSELWSRIIDIDDQKSRNQLIHDLDQAEKTLSVYRHAIHERLDTSTEELIARYKENPLLCIDILPLRNMH